MSQQLIFTNNPGEVLDRLIAEMQVTQVFVLVDENTNTCVLPKLKAESKVVNMAKTIVCPAGDMHKNIDSLQAIWAALSSAEASRQALLVNIGGGVVTDMGGFAAATFKRGIRCINMPTTLLGAVDAAVGGKTGINFDGIKNLVGAFAPADAVIISTKFFTTLPQMELLSGYGEMLKHGLLAGQTQFYDLLTHSLSETSADLERLLQLLKESVSVKERIVAADPKENSVRRALNLGHTIGHAFESLSHKRKMPVAHGYAVAWGLVAETVLSHLQLGFAAESLHALADYVLANYGAFEITCDDYPELLAYMRNDKKNANADSINFTLLRAPGDFAIDQIVVPEQIAVALDIYRDLMHL